MDPCLFCRIVTGELPATRVHEDAQSLAFEDIRPQAPTHLVIVPKSHIARVLDVTAAQTPLLGHLVQVANALARARGIADDGFRLVVNSGPAGGQTVHHLHLHLLGGRAMQWPPG